mgnify:FL=1
MRAPKFSERRQCEQCGKEFAVGSNNRNQQYCSRACRDDAARKRVIVYCATCGKPKEITQGRAETYEHHYCDQKCLGLSRIGVSPANKVDNDIACDVCGKVFHAPPSANQRFCSVECANTVNSQHLRKHNAAQKLTRIQRTCEQCGKSFTISPGAFNRPGYDMGRFCSRACQVERKRQIRGEAHPLKVPYVQLTCQWCGKTYEQKPSVAPKSRFCSRTCHGAWTAHNIGRKETSIEASIRSLLDQMGVPYIQECKIGFYTCDFVIESSRLVIECDGTYWHSIAKVFRRDRGKDKYLSNKGYKVLRLPESLIKSDLEQCRQQILKSL